MSIARQSYVCDKIAYVSQEEANAVALIDGKVLSSDPELYVRKNGLSYHVLMNTWYAQIEELAPRGWVPMQQYAAVNGLTSLIDVACEYSARLVSQLDTSMLPHQLAGAFLFSKVISYNDQTPEGIRLILQTLRYPKRFSPDGADKLKDKSVMNFINYNNKLKMSQRIEPSYYVVSRVKQTLAELLPSKIFDSFNSKSHPGYVSLFLIGGRYGKARPPRTILVKGKFSSGSTTNAGKSLPLKVAEYFRAYGHYCDGLYPSSWNNARIWGLESPDWSNIPECVSSEGEAIAVNKAYDKARIIVRQHSTRQHAMQAVAGLFYEVFKCTKYYQCIDLEDQSISANLARKASVGDTYATIDLSNASDSLSLSIIKATFPAWAVKFISHVRCKTFKYKLNGRTNTTVTQMCCTSGEGQTFTVESLFFLAVALTAREIYHALTGEWVSLPQVYGDDMVVDKAIFELTMDLLRSLNCEPNENKSYSGDFAEACGGEYFGGYDISTKYYPRKTLTGGFKKIPDESLAAVIDLQHRLYGTAASEYLSCLVRDYVPLMTSHLPGTECTDLWEPVPLALATRKGPLVPDTPEVFIVPKEEEIVFSWRNPKLRSRNRVEKTYSLHYTGTVMHKPYYGYALGTVTADPCDSGLMQLYWRYSREMDMYSYVEHLWSGPAYMNDVDRLLHVSTSRCWNNTFKVTTPKYQIHRR